MGLQAGKDYSAKDIQSAVRDVFDDNSITVTIKELGHGNATLIVNDEQLASSFSSAKGGKIKWAKNMQGLIKDTINPDEAVNWSGS